MTEEKRISPWIAGVVDTLVGARVIIGTKIPHRNRLAVILMDTAFETACRAFLKHKKKIALSDGHRHRDNLVRAVRGNLKDIVGEMVSGTIFTGNVSCVSALSRARTPSDTHTPSLG